MNHEPMKFFALPVSVLSLHFDLFLKKDLTGRKICLPLQPAKQGSGLFCQGTESKI
jgi:hypothetical protein